MVKIVDGYQEREIASNRNRTLLELAKKEEKSGHKGRAITAEGKSLLDKLATQIYKLAPKEMAVVAKEEEFKAEEPKKEAQAKPAKEKKPKVQAEPAQ